VHGLFGLIVEPEKWCDLLHVFYSLEFCRAQLSMIVRIERDCLVVLSGRKVEGCRLQFVFAAIAEAE
jgi:hypothetical protein